jgi:hypothetical protein
VLDPAGWTIRFAYGSCEMRLHVREA